MVTNGAILFNEPIKSVNCLRERKKKQLRNFDSNTQHLLQQSRM